MREAKALCWRIRASPEKVPPSPSPLHACRIAHGAGRVRCRASSTRSRSQRTTRTRSAASVLSSTSTTSIRTSGARRATRCSASSALILFTELSLVSSTVSLRETSSMMISVSGPRSGMLHGVRALPIKRAKPASSALKRLRLARACSARTPSCSPWTSSIGSPTTSRSVSPIRRYLDAPFTIVVPVVPCLPDGTDGELILVAPEIIDAYPLVSESNCEHMFRGGGGTLRETGKVTFIYAPPSPVLERVPVDVRRDPALSKRLMRIVRMHRHPRSPCLPCLPRISPGQSCGRWCTTAYAAKLRHCHAALAHLLAHVARHHLRACSPPSPKHMLQRRFT